MPPIIAQPTAAIDVKLSNVGYVIDVLRNAMRIPPAAAIAADTANA